MIPQETHATSMLLGDIGSGHGNHFLPTTAGAPSDVFIDGQQAMRGGDNHAAHG
ncbi:hypothetical protein [Mesorhizobium retamae]|uniref:hypothetical protein n=1 Tax=Mesorhizobium retamae TaxID=2912854 RepID=UPI001EF502E6|nr:hypothetical protein [Mesorhizobium sp. IRAMC:0171]